VKNENRLRVAVQKSGRLAEKSTALFLKCGLDFDLRKDRLLHHSPDFPIDLMLVRDDDIPEYVADGVCDFGIVGENVIQEKYFSQADARKSELEILLQLGFGSCRLSIAVPSDFVYESPKSLQGLKIATSYPSCLTEFLRKNQVDAKILELSGSVEIAPALQIADAICDLVSTGATLQSNGLREVTRIFTSQACFVRRKAALTPQKTVLLERLMQRVRGVLKASRSKYIMMNAPTTALPRIRDIIPGMEEPSVIPLGLDGMKIAIHAVASEDVFWETIENLKAVGATSILVLPIEKVIA
jgi:ATP phosphoribosyltransferase